MSLIDTSQWKEFRIGNLLGPAKHGNWIDPKSLDENEDGYQIVSASTINNGVSIERYSILNEKYIVPARVITWGKQSPFFAYQKEPTISGQGVYYYDVSQRTSQQALFLCGVMQSKIAEKYNYQDCLIGCKCDEETICLPATPSGEPDWDYMDSFMKKILDEEEAAAEQLAALAPESGDDGDFLDVSGWKAFRIRDLFEKLSLGFKANRKFDKALDVDTKPSNEFDLPLVNAKDGNNGIMYWGRSADWDSAEMTLDIVMDGAVSAGNVYAQPQHTGVLYNAYLIKPFYSMSTNCLQFVATVMQSAIKEQFGYMNKCTWDRVSALPIYLPVTSDGQPDWAWMEQYMQQQLDKVASLGEHLNEVMK